MHDVEGTFRKELPLTTLEQIELLSISIIQHAVEGSPTILRFDPDRVVEQECLITTFQNAYFYTRNFEEAQQKLR